jgi:hypothetical protein
MPQLQGFLIMKRIVVYGWNYIFNSEVSPLRNISDASVRHYVLQALGFMWAVSFCVAIGGYTFLAANIIAHAVLIGAAAITVATYTTAAVKPAAFKAFSRPQRNGEQG